MSATNEISVIKLNGIFQYFLNFNQSSKRKLPNKKLTFKLGHEQNVEENVRDNELMKKKVRFNTQNKIYKMCVWQFAYKQARTDQWQKIARDQERFKRKIEELDEKISPILLKKLELTHF